VQGEGAREEIAQAIEDFNLFNEQLVPADKIEVMIVGRGGGSIEDLWAFNEEVVARAIYASKIPVISAVGHERDFTVSDLVADLRAATPSQAAELVLPKKEDLREKLDDLSRSLKRSFLDINTGFQQELDGLAHRLGLNIEHALRLNIGRYEAAVKKLSLLNPAAILQQYKIKTQDLARQIYVRISHFLKLKEASFNKAAEKLVNLNPLNILSRGYSVTFKMPQEEVVKDGRVLEAGEIIKTRLHQGEIISQVREVK